MATSVNLITRLFQSKEKSVSFSGLVSRMSVILDRVAGLCMFSIMVLVVTNVITREIFNHAILGTYEYAGYLTAVLIGLSLANCAVNKGHIAVDFIIERFPAKIKTLSDIITHGLALCFFGLSAWHVGIYAYNLSLQGVVSPTTQTPFYYFIYLVALGLFALSLVLLINFLESVRKVTD